MPSSATAVRTALAKGNYAAALAEADKIAEKEMGADLKRTIQGQISGRVASMKTSFQEGDFLTASESATDLQKDLAGLPEAPEAEKVLADIKANKDSPAVITAQKKIRGILEQKLGKRREFEKAASDLKEISTSLKGTYASKEADAALATITKRKDATR